jgi:hypothetical protein
MKDFKRSLLDAFGSLQRSIITKTKRVSEGWTDTLDVREHLIFTAVLVIASVLNLYSRSADRFI